MLQAYYEGYFKAGLKCGEGFSVKPDGSLYLG